MASEEVQENISFRCRVHAEELLPLLCKDCDSPVCIDCLTASHAGHQLCKIRECIEDIINHLNDVIESNASARFDLKKIEENLQSFQDRLKEQVKEMVQRVTEREEEIIREVKNVCQKTIEQLKNLATEKENSMKNDEEILNRLKTCDKFQKENDKDFMKSLYLYNELKLLQDKYVARDQRDIPFSYESCDLSVEKIVEVVGFILTIEHSSSDEDLENVGILPIPHETNTNNESLPHQYKKSFTKSSFTDIVLISPEKKIIGCEENIYHLTKTNVHKLGRSTEHFTYVAETDEIIYTCTEGGDLKIYRQPASTDGSRTLLFSCGNEKPLCLGHDVANYLTILTETFLPFYLRFFKTESQTSTNNFCIRFVDEIGCLSQSTCHDEKKSVPSYGRFKICRSSFVQIRHDKILVKKGFTFDNLFSYSGRRCKHPKRTFSPSDVCADPDSNFVAIDSHDNTVHLLDPKGEFLRIIMSEEDGLSGITRVAMDTIGWMWIGCHDGSIHFANYQYFKRTTRQERYLERQKNKENA